jgi:hypothetical protein
MPVPYTSLRPSLVSGEQPRHPAAGAEVIHGVALLAVRRHEDPAAGRGDEARVADASDRRGRRLAAAQDQVGVDPQQPRTLVRVHHDEPVAGRLDRVGVDVAGGPLAEAVARQVAHAEDERPVDVRRDPRGVPARGRHREVAYAARPREAAGRAVARQVVDGVVGGVDEAAVHLAARRLDRLGCTSRRRGRGRRGGSRCGRGHRRAAAGAAGGRQREDEQRPETSHGP